MFITQQKNNDPVKENEGKRGSEVETSVRRQSQSILDLRMALTDKDKFAMACSKAQEHILQKFYMTKQFQPQLNPTIFFLLNQICLNDPKCLNIRQFDNVKLINSRPKKLIYKPVCFE